ncbi:sugar transporter sweet1 [Anaeramoeba flamelloides]|uniref:Sugar transporter sweet1 n=1 Tax=Anaeramoeba flamelloides TaxID=1746091 RepID=A0AAV7YFW7_9EUKA|nr:sugar transporter sweet1 [Anaeramoeba flamelloides]
MILQALATVLTILQFFSPYSRVKELNQSTKSTISFVSSFPFIMALTNATCWFIYGFVIGDDLLLLINVVCVSVSIYFVVVVYQHNEEKRKVRLVFYLFIFLYGSVLIGCNYVKQSTKNRILGFISMSISLSSNASPCVMIRKIIKTKDSSILVIHRIIANGSSATVWCLYGLSINNKVVFLPSTISCCISAILFFIYFLYRNADQDKNQKKANTDKVI